MLTAENYIAKIVNRENQSKTVKNYINKYVIKNTYQRKEEIVEGYARIQYFFPDRTTLILTDRYSVDPLKIMLTDKSSIPWASLCEWIFKQHEQLQTIVSCDLNFSFILRQYRMALTTGGKTLSQMHTTSTIVAMNPVTIFPLAIIQNACYDENVIPKLTRFFETPKPTKLPVEKAIVFEARALSEMIKAYLYNFCCDRIYANQSAFQVNQLGTRILSHDVTIFSTPYDGIFFDSEGNLCPRKEIIKDGRLVDFISNQRYSDLLNINCVGNADFEDSMKIELQRIEFLLHRVAQSTDSASIRIHAAENIYFDCKTGLYQATIKFCNNTTVCACPISFSMETIVENMLPVSDAKWNNNVLCPDVWITNGINSLL